VGFRIFTARAARHHGVSGFVRNLPDGRVEAMAEGERRQVEGFIDDLRRGPAGAVIHAIETQWMEPEGSSGFAIR
ncbi:MAG: acylphosphatase, partial [bacterium]